MDDTAEDRAAIRPVISQIDFYPLTQFDGTMKTTDWTKIPKTPVKTGQKSETVWVHPETFFDVLPSVMKRVPPLPGEEALYHWIGSVLEAAATDPEVKQGACRGPRRNSSAAARRALGLPRSRGDCRPRRE
jgi:hypothetical protein